MDEKELRALLSSVQNGSTDVDDALLKLRMKPFDDIGYAKVDLQRGVRTGTAEVIFGAGKTAEQITGIAGSMLENGQKTILVTRLDKEKAEQVRIQAAGRWQAEFFYNERGRIAVIGSCPRPDGIGRILVISSAAGEQCKAG